MKQNYAELSGEELTAEHKRLHKKLMPANIVVFILSVVALVTLLIGPVLDMRMRITQEFVSDVYEQAMEESGESQPDAEEQRIMNFMFKDIDETVHISVKPIDMFKAAIASDSQETKDFLKSIISDALESMSRIGEQVLPAMLSVLTIQQVGDGLPENLEEISTAEFETLVSMLQNQQLDEASLYFSTAAQNFASDQLGITLTQSDLASLQDGFDEIVARGTDENGEFSFMNVITSMGQEGSSGEEGDSANPFEDFYYQIDEMNDSDLQALKMGLTAASVAGVLLSAFCWLMLALLSLVHIFAKNKKVGMWYVKLTGLTPCLLFVILPLVALKLIPKFVSGADEAMGMVSSLGVGFGGLTIVSAVCLLLLWCVSIFWCHPIKKRIKQCKRTMTERGYKA